MLTNHSIYCVGKRVKRIFCNCFCNFHNNISDPFSPTRHVHDLYLLLLRWIFAHKYRELKYELFQLLNNPLEGFHHQTPYHWITPWLFLHLLYSQINKMQTDEICQSKHLKQLEPFPLLLFEKKIYIYKT